MKIGSPEKSYPIECLPEVARLLRKLTWLRLLAARNGNTLLYIVVVMVIFGFLGVTMVSLFTTSTVSSGTPNDTRRALYLAESGARYAMAELRRTEFASAAIARFNTPATFSLASAGSFTVNVFGPWFDSTATDSVSGGTFQLTVPEGRIPAEFTIPAGASIVNADYVGTSPDQSTQTAQVQSFERNGDTGLTVTLYDDFAAREHERICLAFKSAADYPPVTNGGTVLLPLAAKDVFPKRDGAIRIDSVDYVYSERDDLADHIELTNIQRLDGGTVNFGVTESTYVMLSPQNYRITPTGTAGGISSGLATKEFVNIFDSTLPEPGEHVPDIAELNPVHEKEPSGRDLINQNIDAKTLDLGHGTADAFGGAWYSGNLYIGGTVPFCTDGRCKFTYGVRIFFTLTYSGTGQGFTLALVNGSNNSTDSIGGDADAPELLAYAGDSRFGGGFLDGTADGLGLRPPKIGVEFDAQPNNSEPLYCNGSSLNTGTRDDPLSDSQDAVQYVFWGRNDSLYIPCRNDDLTYDDNKHNAHSSTVTKLWEYNLGADPALWRPAVGSDGSVYVSVMNGNLQAVTRDGASKWVHFLGGNNADYNPGIDPLDDTLYVDYADFRIDYVDPADGTSKLPPIFIGDDFDSTPVVGPDGRIYFGTNASRALRYDRSGNFVTEYRDTIGTGQVASNVALGPDGTVYFTAWGNTSGIRGALWAFQPNGTKKWNYDILELNSGPNSAKVLSSPAVSLDGSTIYVGSNDNKLYAINSNGTLKWAEPSAGDIQSSPVVASDGTIIHGSDDGYVYAVNDLGTGYSLKWAYPPGDAVISSPIIDPNDGTTYIGSNTNKLYALNPYDGSLIWESETTGFDIRSSPNIGPDGTVYVASHDDKLYALQAFAKPRNYKIDPLESGNPEKYLVTSGDLDATLPLPQDQENWLPNGPWAVRVEVIRSTTQNANGNFEYTLRTWLRQCNDADCSTDNSLNNVKDTFFEDTRIQYDAQEPHLVQTIELTQSEHDAFERFLFGFTTASGPGEDQSAVIGDFQLSFIRPNDPVIASDPNWP